MYTLTLLAVCPAYSRLDTIKWSLHVLPKKWCCNTYSNLTRFRLCWFPSSSIQERCQHWNCISKLFKKMLPLKQITAVTRRQDGVGVVLQSSHLCLTMFYFTQCCITDWWWFENITSCIIWLFVPHCFNHLLVRRVKWIFSDNFAPTHVWDLYSSIYKSRHYLYTQ